MITHSIFTNISELLDRKIEGEAGIKPMTLKRWKNGTSSQAGEVFWDKLTTANFQNLAESDRCSS